MEELLKVLLTVIVSIWILLFLIMELLHRKQENDTEGDNAFYANSFICNDNNRGGEKEKCEE